MFREENKPGNLPKIPSKRYGSRIEAQMRSTGQFQPKVSQ
jgi:hypothetical protein